MSPAPPRFAAAARRHVEDGEHLHSQGRSVTADHLAGLGAECALKAILLDYLGASVGPGGFPVSPGSPTDTKHNVHVDKLWAQVETVASRRAPASFLAAITSSKPFDDWRVEERYADGSQCTSARTALRLATARSLVARHQQARVLGRLL